MKLAIVLMLAFCLALQTQASESNDISEKQNDPFLRGGCVWDFCHWPFKPCCPGKNIYEYVYCLDGKCTRILSKAAG